MIRALGMILGVFGCVALLAGAVFVVDSTAWFPLVKGVVYVIMGLQLLVVGLKLFAAD